MGVPRRNDASNPGLPIPCHGGSEQMKTYEAFHPIHPATLKTMDYFAMGVTIHSIQPHSSIDRSQAAGQQLRQSGGNPD